MVFLFDIDPHTNCFVTCGPICCAFVNSELNNSSNSQKHIQSMAWFVSKY